MPDLNNMRAQDLKHLVLTPEDLRFNDLIQRPDVDCKEVRWFGSGPPKDGHAHRGASGALFRWNGSDFYWQVEDPEWRRASDKTEYDNCAGSDRDLRPRSHPDQPTSCRPEIQEGRPGFVFEYADGRLQGVFLETHALPEAVWVRAYRTDVSPPGDALKFDPNEPGTACQDSVTVGKYWVEVAPPKPGCDPRSALP